jgi:dynein heavy chain
MLRQQYVHQLSINYQKHHFSALKSSSFKQSFQVIAKVEEYEINPKAITLTDLSGAYNLVTGDWKNGFVAKMGKMGKMSSEMADADPKVQQWIIFDGPVDGPVDALWTENMNTVLDDNKLLSLANSDRIELK